MGHRDYLELTKNHRISLKPITKSNRIMEAQKGSLWLKRVKLIEDHSGSSIASELFVLEASAPSSNLKEDLLETIERKLKKATRYYSHILKDSKTFQPCSLNTVILKIFKIQATYQYQSITIKWFTGAYIINVNCH